MMPTDGLPAATILCIVMLTSTVWVGTAWGLALP